LPVFSQADSRRLGKLLQLLNIIDDRPAFEVYIWQLTPLTNSHKASLLTELTLPLMSAKAASQVTLLGSTGLVGSSALRYMLSSSKYAYSLTTITRSTPPTVPCANASTTHSNRAVSDLAEAVKGSVGSPGGVYITALGTTRRKAGGVAAQRAIDVDLNKQLAAKAREDGSTYVSSYQICNDEPNDDRSSSSHPQALMLSRLVHTRK
jgi:hypothetical protein